MSRETDAIDLAVKSISDEIDTVVERLSDGVPLDQYHMNVGLVRGMRFALEIIKANLNKIMDD